MTITLTPYIAVHDAAAAVDFYTKAFGGKETGTRMTDAKGRIGWTQIEIGDAALWLADEHPDKGFVGPRTLGGCHVILALHVPDADAGAARAVAAGGRLTRPVADHPSGSRMGEITDPFGYRWTLLSPMR